MDDRQRELLAQAFVTVINRALAPRQEALQAKVAALRVEINADVAESHAEIAVLRTSAELAALRRARQWPAVPPQGAVAPDTVAVARSALATLEGERAALDTLCKEAAHLTGEEIRQRLAAMQSRLRCVDSSLG